jgi:hypothetical protein
LVFDPIEVLESSGAGSYSGPAVGSALAQGNRDEARSSENKDATRTKKRGKNGGIADEHARLYHIIV